MPDDHHQLLDGVGRQPARRLLLRPGRALHRGHRPRGLAHPDQSVRDQWHGAVARTCRLGATGRHCGELPDGVDLVRPDPRLFRQRRQRLARLPGPGGVRTPMPIREPMRLGTPDPGRGDQGVAVVVHDQTPATLVPDVVASTTQRFGSTTKQGRGLGGRSLLVQVQQLVMLAVLMRELARMRRASRRGPMRCLVAPICGFDQ